MAIENSIPVEVCKNVASGGRGKVSFR